MESYPVGKGLERIGASCCWGIGSGWAFLWHFFHLFFLSTTQVKTCDNLKSTCRSILGCSLLCEFSLCPNKKAPCYPTTAFGLAQHLAGEQQCQDFPHCSRSFTLMLCIPQRDCLKKLIPGLEHAEFAITFSSPSSFALAPPLCFIKHTVKKQCGCDHACDDTEIISAQHFIESTMSWFG